MNPLFNLLSIPSAPGECDAMRDHIVARCKKYDVATDTLGNVYVTKGNGKTCPAFVAHMDTVHSIEHGGIRPVEIDGYVTGINPLTMAQTGIGGDDKCGIYAALTCLEKLPHAKAAFFVDEEIGCVGSYSANLEFFSDCRFILQADRRGNSDFVESIGGKIQSAAFRKAVRPILRQFRFRPCTGAMTDVMALSDSGVGLSCANISAGYYNPHSRQEYISIPDLEHTISLMLHIAQKLKDVYPHTPPAPRAYKLPAKAPSKPGPRMNEVWADWERERYSPDPYADFTWPDVDTRDSLDWYKGGPLK